MFNFLLSPLQKLGLLTIVSAVVFFAGYYKGYKSENEKFVAFKNEVAIIGKAQNEIVKQIESKQKIITEGIKNEYQAKLSALELRYRRMLNNTNPDQLSRIPEPARAAYEASQDFVLDCAFTTQQLVSLQDWIKLQKTTQ
jgi:hypothetical protein